MNLFTATIVAATILSATTSVSNNYVYNVKNTNEAVTEQTVYKVDESGKYLTNHIKYDYSYDNENRLNTKTTLRWNDVNQKWENSSQLIYTYNESNCIVEYARWNKNTNSFSEVTEKVVYACNKLQEVTGYQSFKINEKTNEWHLVMNHEINIPQTDFYWFAQNK
ncbi:DUF3836 domain-containing protein [Bacteroides sp. 519]|uniref:DUF3836 domain-containing protein n=1 Tax=Bacteroides sp. 519 TaxID=2302937 RepID=UPI0013D7089A|nr:DUF3836 domain-containing protein [Bacteroides sp. 519]NDV57691.1 DUF3836 domain-containing protein [Bacteroides sp. 519]